MNGIGVSPGISIGRACKIEKYRAGKSGILINNEEDKNAEIEKFSKAVLASIEEINLIKSDKTLTLKPEDIEILEVQIEFLNDPQIRSDVLAIIKSECKTANDAVIEVIDAAVQMFCNIGDEYLSSRAADVEDTGLKIVKHLNNYGLPHTRQFGENTIIIAEDIAPSDTVSLDIKRITGFATRSGGRTSHTAIIARSKGIPAVVACGNDLMSIQNNDTIILDGSTGEVIVNPDQNIIELFKARQNTFAGEAALLKSLRDKPAMTTDGKIVRLYANISDVHDLEIVSENGAEGIGLLRTELLFMNRNSFPSEEEQFQFYKQVAIKSKNRSVIVRTLDIGGDKQLSYFGIPHENNPFLGYRAIRISLDRKDIFMTQLKAILRAGVFGRLKILLPMICNIDEVLQSKKMIQLAKDELTSSGIEYDKNIGLGIMTEIPSAALMTDILAKEVDFFSIGTNDLCQYTLAVDRMNDMVAPLYNHFNPGVLRLIYNVIEQAHKYNRNVGMCGEMASDPLATLLLIGMGLDEFSMDAASIPKIKNIIIGSSMLKAREIFSKVMEMESSDKITSYLQEATK